MKIVNCAELENQQIYEAFKLGFSDYMMKFDMDIDTFMVHFFKVEGNHKAFSYVAFDNDSPIGVVLGGIIYYDGLKTLRCGALSIAPEYRGKGVSQQLMQAHYAIARSNKCSQLMLEVLGENNRAIQFYKKQNYTADYYLYYYSLAKENAIFKVHETLPFYSAPHLITSKELSALKETMTDIHVNWQNDFNYFEPQENTLLYGISIIDHVSNNVSNNEIVSFIALNSKGKIYRVYTHPLHRRKGLGSILISSIMKMHSFDKVQFSSPGNSALGAFITSIGFEKIPLYQFEMTKKIIERTI